MTSAQSVSHYTPRCHDIEVSTKMNRSVSHFLDLRFSTVFHGGDHRHNHASQNSHKHHPVAGRKVGGISHAHSRNRQNTMHLRQTGQESISKTKGQTVDHELKINPRVEAEKLAQDVFDSTRHRRATGTSERLGDGPMQIKAFRSCQPLFPSWTLLLLLLPFRPQSLPLCARALPLPFYAFPARPRHANRPR